MLVKKESYKFEYSLKTYLYTIAKSKALNYIKREKRIVELDENLKKVGEISGFATGERIYSVRYVGNKAYVVIFKQIDPLFVIDLSEPTNPQILGQLKIPGYSIYLHPYDETHIIGFGYVWQSLKKFIDKLKICSIMFSRGVTNENII